MAPFSGEVIVEIGDQCSQLIESQKLDPLAAWLVAPHVGKQVDHRLLHVDALCWRIRISVVISVKADCPFVSAGTEYQRTACCAI